MERPAVTREGAPLRCDGCGGDDFDGPEEGSYFCRACGGQSQDVLHATCDDEDIHGDAGDGALYSVFHRRKSQPQAPKNPNIDQILKNLSQTLAGGAEDAVPGPPPGGFDEPQDFGGGGPCPGARALADGIRLRYVQGLQVMLQRQCEVLVEQFGASPLICGLAATVWLRYVAASRVFDDGWADKVIAESEAAVAAAAPSPDGEQAFSVDERKLNKRIKAKYRWEPHNKYGQRAIYIWCFSLRKTIPVYSSLAISFLACHLAREAILPTDISDWALEGKLPYLTAFIDMDKHLGTAWKTCPLSSRFMFRPIRVIGAWELEATAGSVAQTIGLHTPSVNFYGIARRYLKELSLSVEKILPYACRLYEWSIPADLWLSSNAHRLPTFVCVMAMLIVAMRILYNIHGQGTWEMSLSDLSNSRLNQQKVHLSSASNSEKQDDGAKEYYNTTDSVYVKKLTSIQASEYNTVELLCTLEATYERISKPHDYSKDLASYLKYCKDVVFAGRAASFEEERLMERLWNIYEKQEDNNLGDDVKRENFESKEKRPSYEVTTGTLSDSKKPRVENQDTQYTDKGELASKDCLVNDSMGLLRECPLHDCSSRVASSAAVEKMKLNMEENGFQYLPPRTQLKTDAYLHYRRQRTDGKLIYVAHADYYILLRACAKLAQVDARIMHAGVMKLERRLDWIEQRVISSMSSSTEPAISQMIS